MLFRSSEEEEGEPLGARESALEEEDGDERRREDLQVVRHLEDGRREVGRRDELELQQGVSVVLLERLSSAQLTLF